MKSKTERETVDADVDLHDLFRRIDHISAGGELLSKLPYPHEQRETLIQIGEEAGLPASLVERRLAPWNPEQKK